MALGEINTKRLAVITGLILMFIVSASLRFTNLSYSELQDDEKKTRITLENGESLTDFFLRQRKGPMQFLVAYLPNQTYDSRPETNELAVRLPFTVANLIAVFVLYGFVYKVTKSHLASLFAGLLFSVNGFVVGFSRISQYQSLNMLFSFAALYFFADLKYKKEKLIWSSFLGALFISLSILSHWDAVFVGIPIAYFFIYLVFRKDIGTREKIINILITFLVMAILVSPFAIAYILNLLSGTTGNVEYLGKRVGIDGSTFTRHRTIFELYNPLIALWLYLAGIAAAVLFVKRTWLFLIWFVSDLLVIKLLMVTPKTHIYNYVVPGLVTAAVGFYYLFNFLREKINIKLLKIIPYGLAAALFTLTVLLYVQSWQIFVDHTKEYPFDEKKILWYLNPVFIDEEIITFGFPHFRDWKTVSSYIDTDCRYITNESKGISQIYVEAEYGSDEDCQYIVYIRRPFYVKNQDVIYAGLKDSKLRYKYERNGETLTKVYRMK